MSGVFRALPAGVAFWLVAIGVFVSPWLMLAGGLVGVYALFVLLKGSKG